MLNGVEFVWVFGVDGKIVVFYFDLLVDLMLVCWLGFWYVNIGKRLVKLFCIYVCDIGILYVFLGFILFDDVLGYFVVGVSWEGFVIEMVYVMMLEGM